MVGAFNKSVPEMASDRGFNPNVLTLWARTLGHRKRGGLSAFDVQTGQRRRGLLRPFAVVIGSMILMNLLGLYWNNGDSK